MRCNSVDWVLNKDISHVEAMRNAVRMAGVRVDEIGSFCTLLKPTLWSGSSRSTAV